MSSVFFDTSALAECRRVYTFNLSHFNTLAQNRIEISLP